MSENNYPDWDISDAYERYANSVPSAVQNARIRPEGQDIFDWLMEDKELVHETDIDLKAAGLGW